MCQKCLDEICNTAEQITRTTMQHVKLRLIRDLQMYAQLGHKSKVTKDELVSAIEKLARMFDNEVDKMRAELTNDLQGVVKFGRELQ